MLRLWETGFFVEAGKYQPARSLGTKAETYRPSSIRSVAGPAIRLLRLAVDRRTKGEDPIMVTA